MDTDAKRPGEGSIRTTGEEDVKNWQNLAMSFSFNFMDGPLGQGYIYKVPQCVLM